MTRPLVSLYPRATVFLSIMLFPVYWMVNASLQPGVSTANLRILPLSPSLDGYREAFASQGANLATSLVVSLGAVAICLCVATPAAYSHLGLQPPADGSLFS